MKILLSRPALLAPLDIRELKTPNLCEFEGFLISKCEGFKPLPSGVSRHFQTRTNTLLYNAALKLDKLVKALKKHFGEENLALIIGTTTTGVEENLMSMREKGLAGYDECKQSLANPALFLRSFWGLKGLCYGVSNACTSGAKALIEGVRLIRAGLCKVAIVGGVDSINTLTLWGFKALSITSNKPSRAFCEDREGINIGEAAGLFVMMSENALKECDESVKNEFKVELAGFASNTDAFAITQPSSDLNVKKALLDEALGVNLNENGENCGVNLNANSHENSQNSQKNSHNSNENSQKSVNSLENSALARHSEPAKAGEESTTQNQSLNLKMDSSLRATHSAQNDNGSVNSLNLNANSQENSQNSSENSQKSVNSLENSALARHCEPAKAGEESTPHKESVNSLKNSHENSQNLQKNSQNNENKDTHKNPNTPKIDYISAHGTGTQDNDRVEAEFIATFLPRVSTSSVKPFMGHNLAACGAVEAGLCADLILQSLEKGEATLPPQIYENIDKKFSKELNLAGFNEKKCVKNALSLNFAFGGDNALLYLRAYDGR